MAVEERAEVPPAGRFAVKAAGVMLLPRRPRPNVAPRAELLVRGVRPDRDRLARYAEVCGFAASDTLPPTYPHVLAFGLALDLMTRPDFPFPLAGLVHIENVIEVHRDLGADVPLDLAVRAEGLRAHDRGRLIDVVTTATVDGTVAWFERSTYLRRAPDRPGRRPPAELPAPPPATATWPVRRDVGRAYAKVSGDRNPIHTSTIGARLFGFPGPIAHGMWTLARGLSALPSRPTTPYTVEASFRRPLLLPSTVRFSTDGRRFAVHDVSGRPHLEGTAAADS